MAELPNVEESNNKEKALKVHKGMLPKALKKYLQSADLSSYSSEVQDSYNAKLRNLTLCGIEDLILLFKNQSRFSHKQNSKKIIVEEATRELLEELLEALLETSCNNYNQYINDYDAYGRALVILKATNLALNKIMNQDKVTNMKLLKDLGNNRWRNIGYLESMSVAYWGDLEKADNR